MPFPGKELILAAAETIDAVVLGPVAGRQPDSEGVLVSFLFHRFFEPEELVHADRIYPHEGVTVGAFERFVALLAARGFRFVLPRDLLAGRPLAPRSAMLTVDDGYADNLRILPVLERWGAKAVFLISGAHVGNGLRFWPDALYAGAARAGWSVRARRRALGRLRLMRYEEAVRCLEGWFGEDVMTTPGDLGRPMTVAELRALASSPRVEIGSHAYHHTVLTPRPERFVHDELERSIDFLTAIVGRRPMTISYPNGLYSETLKARCRRLGFGVGLTIEARASPLREGRPVGDLMQLGRFTVSGGRRLDRQLASAVMARSAMRALYGFKQSKVTEDATA